MSCSRTAVWPLCLAATLLTPCARAQKQPEIKLATLLPRDGSGHKVLEDLKATLQKAEGGGVKLTLRPDYTEGESAMVAKMKAGALQAGLITVVGISEIDKSVSALQNLPLMFQDLAEVDHVQAALTPMLEKRLSDKGFYVLCWVDAGWVRWFSRKPILTPDDLRQQKLFCWSSDSPQFDLMKKHGLKPVLLEPTDVKASLATGMIDAIATPPFAALAFQYFDDTKNVLMVEWAPLVGGLVVTKKAFEALPEATRTAFRAAATAMGVKMRERNRKEADEALATLQKKGITVNRPSKEQGELWAKFADEIWPDVRGNIVPADLFDEVKKILAERRAKK